MYIQGEKLKGAITIIMEQLSEGEKTSEVLYKIAEAHGISRRTFDRAKYMIGVKSRRCKQNKRMWSMTDAARAKYYTDDEIASDLPIIYRSVRNEPAAAEWSAGSIQEEENRLDVSKLRRIFLICKPSGFGGKYDYFVGLVPSALANDVMNGDAFVFCDRSKLQISVLQWQGDGYALFFKRAEYGSFGWPVNKKATAIEITSDDLKILLEYPRLMLRLSGVSTPFAVI